MSIESPPLPRLDGPTLFARFAYPPNALGLCGPSDHDELFGYASSGLVDAGLRQLARGFDGAWPYLELIAGCNGCRDPLDRAVVEAYWIGNRLSRAVPLADLERSAHDRFRARTGSHHDAVAAAIFHGLAPTHAFHVFAVYPWAGLLRSGRAEPALHILDQCRIRWGEVVERLSDEVLVRSQPLVSGAAGLQLAAPRLEVVKVALDGDPLVADLVAGDLVALHWDWVCARITPAEVGELRRQTARCLASVGYGGLTPD